MTIDTLKKLNDIKGGWAGTSQLLVPPMNIDETTQSNITVSPLLGGTFLRADYTWSFQGKPQTGSMLIGQSDDEISMYWIDSWHMGKKVLVLRGTASTEYSMDVRGSYPAPEGPDWGWRIQLSRDHGKLRIVHHNVEPSGTEHLAIDASYEGAAAPARATRSKAKAKKSKSKPKPKTSAKPQKKKKQARGRR